MSKRNLMRGLAAAALSLAGWLPSWSPAQPAWPTQPIKLIVPYPAGGMTDIVSRVLSDELGRQLGTTVVVDNRAGAGGQIGLQALLQAPKDGYTVALVVPATMVTLPLTNPAYKIRPLEQLEPITIAADTFMTLVVDKRLGIKSLKEFVDHAQKHPGQMSYGTPGAGTSFHFNNVVMANKLGIKALHVPYKGEVQMLQDVVGGQLQYALASNAGRAFIESGQVTALAVTAPQRASSLPAVPTFKELGIDFSTDGWVGFVAAKGTPSPILQKLHKAFVDALNTPAVRQKLSEMGYQVVANDPEAFRKIVQDSSKRYGGLLRSGAVKLE